MEFCQDSLLLYLHNSLVPEGQSDADDDDDSSIIIIIIIIETQNL